MAIFQVEQKQLEGLITPELLSKAALQEHNLGKETNTFWIFKSQINIYNNPQQRSIEIDYLNNFCRMAAMNGFDTVMITKNKPSE